MSLIGLPVNLFDLNPETNMRPHLKLMSFARNIILNFLLRREIAAPPMAFAKAETIGMVWRIDTGTRISIFPPRAADVFIFLENNIRQSQIIQQLAQRNTGHTGTNNDNWLVRLLLWFFNLAAQRGEAHLLVHHRRIFGWHSLGQAVRHHAVKQCLIGAGDKGRCVLAQNRQRRGANFSLYRGRQTGIFIRN